MLPSGIFLVLVFTHSLSLLTSPQLSLIVQSYEERFEKTNLKTFFYILFEIVS